MQTVAADTRLIYCGHMKILSVKCIDLKYFIALVELVILQLSFNSRNVAIAFSVFFFIFMTFSFCLGFPDTFLSLRLCFFIRRRKLLKKKYCTKFVHSVLLKIVKIFFCLFLEPVLSSFSLYKGPVEVLMNQSEYAGFPLLLFSLNTLIIMIHVKNCVNNLKIQCS